MGQTDIPQRGGEGDGKRLIKGPICIYASPMDINNSVVTAWGGAGAGREQKGDIIRGHQ